MEERGRSMICVDTKFFNHIVTCMEMQKIIYLQPLKVKVEWQDKIDKTIDQCKSLLEDVMNEEKKASRRRSTFMIPDSSLFDDSRFMSINDDLGSARQ